VNTNSADEFGNKVQGCGTEDAKILYCYTVLLIIVIIIFLNFLAHWHKAAGRKTRLDIQNYGCNGNLLCYHIVVERNRNSKGMKKITLRNTKKYTNQTGMNLTPPPPPSQNSHVVRWHCTAESKRRFAEIKMCLMCFIIIIFLAHQHKACRQLKIKQEMTAVGD